MSLERDVAEMFDHVRATWRGYNDAGAELERGIVELGRQLSPAEQGALLKLVVALVRSRGRDWDTALYAIVELNPPGTAEALAPVFLERAGDPSVTRYELYRLVSTLVKLRYEPWSATITPSSKQLTTHPEAA